MNEITEYKTGELSNALGVTSNTIRAWADTYSGLLSDGATANKRTFTADDALLLATVADFRERGVSFDAIQQALENGQRIETMPDVPTPQEQQVKQAEGVVLQSQYDGLQALFNEVQARQSELQQELDVIRQERNELQRKYETETSEIREQWRKEIGEKDKRINDLEKELGIAQGKLGERKGLTFWLPILAGTLLTVIVLAALVVWFILANTV